MPSGKNDYEFIQYYDVNDPEFLSELLKKSTFFEKISSYTETSPTDEYTHNTYYLAEATRWIPLTVQYVCAHCEQINTDYRQFLTAKGKSGSTSSRKAAMSPERKMEARRKLDANVQSVLENFKNRDYQRLAFTCTCSNCHKRQPWSSYFRISPWKIWSFIAGALFLLCFLRARISLPVVVLWLVFLSLMVPLSIDWIKKGINTFRSDRMDKKYLPHFSLPSKSNIMSSFTKEDREPNADEWRCPSCGRINKKYVGSCGCGYAKNGKK